MNPATPSVSDLSSKRDDRAAVEKALSLLDTLASAPAPGIGLSAIARRAGLSKSTVFRLIAILERQGAVLRSGNNYRVGPMVQRLSLPPSPLIHETIRDAVTPYMVELYHSSRETVHLAVLVGTDVLFLNKLPGQRRLEIPSRIGGRLPAHTTALGKAILAKNPRAAAAARETHLVGLTSDSIVDPAQLERELARVRVDGLAYDRGECRVGVTCIAAPIITPQGHAVAALSVTGAEGVFNALAVERDLRRVAYAATRALPALGRPGAASIRGMGEQDVA